MPVHHIVRYIHTHTHTHTHAYIQTHTCAEGVAIDGDNPDHILWLYERAQDRAKDYRIQGVTYRLTQGGLGYLPPLSLSSPTPSLSLSPSPSPYPSLSLSLSLSPIYQYHFSPSFILISLFIRSCEAHHTSRSFYQCSYCWYEKLELHSDSVHCDCIQLYLSPSQLCVLQRHSS